MFVHAGFLADALAGNRFTIDETSQCNLPILVVIVLYCFHYVVFVRIIMQYCGADIIACSLGFGGRSGHALLVRNRFPF